MGLVVCSLIFLAPLIYIQYEYDTFTATYGEVREGAAGAGLALAVVFRTVSRTVLRTVVRTSARAGMRASLRGVFRSGMRVALRGGSAGILRKVAEKKPPAVSVGVANLRSLAFASALLYASWVIVLGLGQPYQGLLTRDQAIAEDAQKAAEEEAELARLAEQARRAYEAQQIFLRLQEEYRELKVQLKMERDGDKQAALEEAIDQKVLALSGAEFELEEAKAASGGRVLAPEDAAKEEERARFPRMEQLKEELFTYAPYPGRASWGAPVIWLGGLAMVLPLWLIYVVQAAVARQKGMVLRHETGVDGGFIQLYFAGAFSFMPLTSDVVLDKDDPAARGQIALAGLLVPVAVSVALWAAWRATGLHALLFLSDAFLIHPMVQVFPLHPLEGAFLWRYSRLGWLVLFIFVMFLFLFTGSEALRSVI